jgi:hypothetical protein
MHEAATGDGRQGRSATSTLNMGAGTVEGSEVQSKGNRELGNRNHVNVSCTEVYRSLANNHA